MVDDILSLATYGLERINTQIEPSPYEQKFDFCIKSVIRGFKFEKSAIILSVAEKKTLKQAEKKH